MYNLIGGLIWKTIILRSSGEKKTILIVDDEQKIVDLLVHNLTREGYNTIEANDGQTAIDLAISQRPDLILLDVMIPRVDGLTVCKKIKN